MHTYKWAPGVRMVVAPARVPEYATQFLEESKLHADGITSDAATLRKTFHLDKADPPNGVAIENGRVKQTFVAFDDSQPKTGLKELGWIQ